MNLQAVAKSLFVWIEEGKVELGAYEFPERPIIVPDIHKPGLMEQLLDQPRINNIRQKWRPVFTSETGPDIKQSNQFIQQVLSSFISIDPFLDFRCCAGFTEVCKNSWNDYRTYRPGQSGWSLTMTVAGAADYNCMRKQQRVEKNGLILLSPEALQDYQRASDSDIWKPYWVTFQPDPGFVDLLNWPEIGPGVHYLCCDDETEAAQLENSFMELARLSGHHDQHTVRLRYNLTEQLLLRCYQLLPESQRVVVDPRVQKAMDYIDQHLTDDIAIKAIADEACVSESTLSRLFRHQTGQTVLGWRDEKRMRLACQKLTHSTMLIAEIAELVGYSDPLYFSRCFRKQMGCSPSDFRSRYLDAK